jgi:hypothetical protein
VFKKEWLLVFFIIMVLSLILGTYFYICSGSLSNNSDDWGNFGSYLAGTITIPASIASLIFIYKTYKTARDANFHTFYQSQLNEDYMVLKDAADFIEESLNHQVKIGENVYTYREAHTNLEVFEQFQKLIEQDKNLKASYRISVVKPLLCLYDFLNYTQQKHGITNMVRFYKVRYQWLLKLHNDYKIDQIKSDVANVSAEQIYEFFYQLET